MEAINSDILPVVVNGFVLYSIFDDTDRIYHADSVTGQTPNDERAAYHAEDKTAA